MLVLDLFVLSVVGGIVGFHEGLYLGSECFLRESDFARDTLPVLGTAGADLFAATYVVTPLMLESGGTYELDIDTLKAELNAYKEGKWELSAPRFLERLKQAGDRIVKEMLPQMRIQLKKDFPMLSEGTGEKLLDWFVDTFGETIIRSGVEEQSSRLGLNSPLTAIVNGLPDEAAREGSPEGLTHKELSSYLVQQTVVAGILLPIKSFVRGHQIVSHL